MMKTQKRYNSIFLAILVTFFIFSICPNKNLCSLNTQYTQTENIENALFKSLKEKLELARKNKLDFYAPKSYQKAVQLYESARTDFKAGARLADIRQKIDKASEHLEQAFKAAQISRSLLEDLVRIRLKLFELGANRYASQELSKSERYVREAVSKVEEGDIRSARSEVEKAYEQYREATIKWLKSGILEKTKENLKGLRRKVSQKAYERCLDELKNLEESIDISTTEKFNPLELKDNILAKLKDILEPFYPPFYRDLPQTLLIGEFQLIVEAYTDRGHWDFDQNQAVGLSGTAWLSFSCGLSLIPFIPQGFLEIKNMFEVVSEVTDPENQISLEEARLISPHVRLGEKLELVLASESRKPESILKAKVDLLNKLKLKEEKKGDILVHFDNVTITQVPGRANVGRIIQGKAAYPTEPPQPEIINLSIEGFTVWIDSLNLSPTSPEAVAHINLQLPQSIGSPETCEPVVIDLGLVSITPNCEFYIENLNEHFGPWIVDDLGMFVTGTGHIFEVDFSSTKSPAPKSPSWKGLILKNGTATGNGLVSENSNTGYLTGDYVFSEAEVTGTGFAAELTLSGALSFHPSHPPGYLITVEGGKLIVSESRITSGQLGPGKIVLPETAVCKDGNPGSSVEAKFTSLTVEEDLDLACQAAFPTGTFIAWGELTHPGEEVIAWKGEVNEAYLYLPARPVASFSPDTGSTFLNFTLAVTLNDIIMQLETLGLAGITLRAPKNLTIYSPDRPGGTTNPIKMTNISGWLHIGNRGVDGELKVNQWGSTEDIGDNSREGYVGKQPFRMTLTGDIERKKPIFFQYATSAVYDSEINGTLDIPEPCDISKLPFSDMEATSTANLVGGDITIPSGVELAYWKLGFEATGADPTQAGVISERTGRLIFTESGISEYVHFEKVFPLIWCEILADGNIGELFLDLNSYGQKFDGLPYSTHNLALSEYIPGNTDGFLAVCGTVHFNFFGQNFINIQDARYDASSSAPYFSRYVKVPKSGLASCEQTDLTLHGEWHDALGNGLAVFDFPDAEMQYNETIQEGFMGTGTSSISFIHSDGINSTVEIHRDATDICLSATATHDIDFGLFPSPFSCLAGISELYGCARIVGPQLERIALGGYLEQSASGGSSVFAPKSGYAVSINISTTPNSCTFHASGDMLLSIEATAIDVSGSVTLSVDFTRLSAEGDVEARIDCNAVLAGLSGEGQITWYTDPTTQYFQGKMSMEICSWTGGLGLEGGLFIGHNVPKKKAWVLQTGSEHFGVSDSILPDTLTGIYGYGQLSFGVQWYIFGGGVEVYAGMGAFSESPSGLATLWSDFAGLGFPYIIGSLGLHVYGEILGGLVSASAWADLDLRGPSPIYYEGTFGLEGCVLWVICASVDVTAGLSPSRGFYIE